MEINYTVIRTLSQEQIEEAYNFQRFNRVMEDIRSHICEMANEGAFSEPYAALLNSEASTIADMYLNEYQNADIAENDTYRQVISDYFEEVKNSPCMLISVYEREISTKIFPAFDVARAVMIEKLQHEINKADLDIHLEQDAEFTMRDDFGITSSGAWSNLDDDCNCDWKIVRV